jgi:hypothetical protein
MDNLGAFSLFMGLIIMAGLITYLKEEYYD